MQERRYTGRFMCAELIRVNWTIGGQRFETTEAMLEDISASGGCVQVDQPIPVGCSIMLTIGGERFSGRVRYCVSREFGYFVGVRFEEDDAWSVHSVIPAHLTDMTAMLRT